MYTGLPVPALAAWSSAALPIGVDAGYRAKLLQPGAKLPSRIFTRVCAEESDCRYSVPERLLTLSQWTVSRARGINGRILCAFAHNSTCVPFPRARWGWIRQCELCVLLQRCVCFPNSNAQSCRMGVGQSEVRLAEYRLARLAVCCESESTCREGLCHALRAPRLDMPRSGQVHLGAAPCCALLPLHPMSQPP